MYTRTQIQLFHPYLNYIQFINYFEENWNLYGTVFAKYLFFLQKFWKREAIKTNGFSNFLTNSQ